MMFYRIKNINYNKNSFFKPHYIIAHGFPIITVHLLHTYNPHTDIVVCFIRKRACQTLFNLSVLDEWRLPVKLEFLTRGLKNYAFVCFSLI